MTDIAAPAELEASDAGPSEALDEHSTSQHPTPVELPEDRYSNREMSWLSFNARVLALSEDRRLPLLERMKFLSIFASNLDEFYMVRVAGLKRRLDMGLAVRGPDGWTPRETLARLAERSREL